MSKTIVLLNPHAAGGKAAGLAEPLRALAITCTAGRFRNSSFDDSSPTSIDALPKASRVIVVGGDGTMNQLLPSLLKGSHTMALVPFGSGNDTRGRWGCMVCRGKKPWRMACWCCEPG